NSYGSTGLWRQASGLRFARPSGLHALEFVPELLFLCFEVLADRLRSGDHFERQGFSYREAVAFEADELSRVVRQQSHLPDAEIPQDLGPDAVIALVRLEAELLVCFDGVEPLILQLVRAKLIGEPDAPPFLMQIQKHAATFLRDALERLV